ncbi:MAG: 5-oxoprolinase subunit PxpA [Bacteroidota bacterium]
MKTLHIDINCDVGEGLVDESLLYPYITSCSIATGGHAGDAETIKQAMRLAEANNLHIGAHPSYPDKANFGRKSIDIDLKELEKHLEKQLLEFKALATQLNLAVNHIKPHGALYNDLVHDVEKAEMMVSVIQKTQLSETIYAPDNSVFGDLAQSNGLKIKYEAFGDRAYDDQGRLVKRSQANAVIADPKKVLEQIVNLVKEGRVQTITGKDLKLHAETICIHSDTPQALEILMYLHQQLKRHGISPAK